MGYADWLPCIAARFGTVAPPPDWLEKAWTGAKRRGLDTLTRAEIDAEITAYRRNNDPAPGGTS